MWKQRRCPREAGLDPPFLCLHPKRPSPRREAGSDAVGARLGGEREAPLRDLTRWGGRPLPWALLTIHQIGMPHKGDVSRAAHVRDGVC